MQVKRTLHCFTLRGGEREAGDELFNFAGTPPPIISGFLKIVDEPLIINPLSGQRRRAEPVPGRAERVPIPHLPRPRLTRSPGRGQPAQVDLILLHRPSEPRSPAATWYQSELARIPPPSLPAAPPPPRSSPLLPGRAALLPERLRAAPAAPGHTLNTGGGRPGRALRGEPALLPSLPSLPSPGDAAALPARPAPRSPRATCGGGGADLGRGAAAPERRRQLRAGTARPREGQRALLCAGAPRTRRPPGNPPRRLPVLVGVLIEVPAPFRLFSPR